VSSSAQSEIVKLTRVSAFGPLIKPNVCVLLDVGTKPSGTSIYEVGYCIRDHLQNLICSSSINASRSILMLEVLVER
jgi:hypothetical protein